MQIFSHVISSLNKLAERNLLSLDAPILGIHIFISVIGSFVIVSANMYSIISMNLQILFPILCGLICCLLVIINNIWTNNSFPSIFNIIIAFAIGFFAAFFITLIYPNMFSLIYCCDGTIPTDEYIKYASCNHHFHSQTHGIETTSAACDYTVRDLGASKKVELYRSHELSNLGDVDYNVCHVCQVTACNDCMKVLKTM